MVATLASLKRLAVGALLSAGATVALAQQGAATAPTGDLFDVMEYRVLGNTQLANRDIERVVYPLLGRDKSLDDVEGARQALENAYRQRGFGTVFVDIPEQQIADGVVRLRVSEGRVDRIRVSGARYVSNERLRSAVPALASGEVPNLPQVQSQLTALNARSADLAVTPVLKAGRTPGTVDVELKVDDSLPVQASVDLNDRYTADTSRLRLSATIGYDNLFQRNHSLSLQYQMTPQEPAEARVLAATYVARLSEDDLVAAYVVDTNSDVATVGTLSVLGQGRIYGTRWIRLLPNVGGYYQNLSLGVDWKDFAEDVRIDVDSALQTPISYPLWSTGYTAGYRSDETITSFSMSANLGLRRFLTDAQEFDDKRAFARANFFYLRGAASHERLIGNGFKAFGRIAAQGTTMPLISNEQFSIGGVQSVRGYLEAEELGDIGFAGTLELRSPGLIQAERYGLSELTMHAFVDAGVVKILDPLPEQVQRVDLSSVGAGLRLRGFEGLLAELDWAYPLVTSSRTDEGDSRFHFSVRYDF